MFRKIIDFFTIVSRKKIVFCVSSAVLMTAILAVAITVAVRNAEDEPVMLDTDFLDELGYELEEFDLPPEFDELGQFGDDTDGDGYYFTDGDGDDDPDRDPDRPRQPSTPIVTGLPAVHITTNSGGGIVSRTDYINGTFRVDAPASSRYSSFSQTSVRARGRGNSTWTANKKPYRLNFGESVSFLGLPSGRNFVLLANAFDHSHLRNNVAFAAARTLSFDFVPTAVHVDLYINGRYQGLYTIGDSVRVSSEGIGVNRNGGFLLELGGVKNSVHVHGTDFFHSRIQRFIRVRYPQPRTDLTSAQFNNISQIFNAACDSVLNGGAYEEHFDMLSLIDYFLLTELLYNLDGTFTRSVFVMRNPGGKLRIASVWDYDLAMGNYSADRNRYNVWASVHTDESWFTQPTWINYLIDCPAFQYAVRKRWEQIGTRMYNAAVNEIRNNRTYLNNGVRRNNQALPRRTYRFTSAQTNRISSWSGQLDYVESFLRLRRNWMNNQIAEFPTEPPDGRDVLPGVRPGQQPPEDTTPPPDTTPIPPDTDISTPTTPDSSTSPTTPTLPSEPPSLPPESSDNPPDSPPNEDNHG
jgi:hypothetical protein